MTQQVEISHEWLGRLAAQAGGQSSDADVILDLKVSVEAMQMQGVLSEDVSGRLASRLNGIAMRLIAAGDTVDEGLSVAVSNS